MTHVILLGDSVFDNGAYVGGDPDVRRQLEYLLPKDSRASLFARDGAVIADVILQFDRLPHDATHIVISAGGNDALRDAAILDERATSMSDAMNKLTSVGEKFGQAYIALMNAASRLALPTAVCTIYEPRFPEIGRRRVAATALTVLNDRITREAFARGMALIDLRLICDHDDDFANPIEPSARGGEKIARAIAAFASGASSSAGVFGKR